MGRGSALLAALLVFLVAAQLHADHSQAKELNHDLQNKVILLRNFYRGDRLEYDSAGEPLGNPPPGSWTVDGVIRVHKVSIAHNRLQIHSKRYFVQNTPDGYDLFPSPRDLTIEVDTDSHPITLEFVHSIMNRVFLTAEDRAADLVPDYWKPCFGAQTTAVRKCHMSPRIAPLFRFASPLQSTSAPGDDKPATDTQGIFGSGKGTTAPHAVRAPDPEYSAEARRERVQGIVIIALVVDKFGQPSDIKLVSPIGYGLDEKAMDSVKTWKFEPGRRGSEPMATYATIEVAFHLY